MTDAEKAAAFDAICEIIADAQKTAAYFGQQEGMSAHVETVQADAFRRIVKTFFAEA